MGPLGPEASTQRNVNQGMVWESEPRGQVMNSVVPPMRSWAVQLWVQRGSPVCCRLVVASRRSPASRLCPGAGALSSSWLLTTRLPIMFEQAGTRSSEWRLDLWEV